LAARADLLAAVRLPDTSFRANAGTEVVTDVLFFRKREEETAVVPDWEETVREDRGMHEWWVYNKIYSLHPDWLIGRPTSQGTQYREEEYTVSFDGEPGSEGERLRAKLLETLPANLIAPEDVVRAPEPMIEMPAPAPAEIIPIPDYLPVDQKYRLEGLRQIYNLAKSILSKEANGAPESEVDELRAQLNEAYDRYVLGFGPINSKANSSLLKTNPERWKSAKVILTSRKRPSFPAPPCAPAGNSARLFRRQTPCMFAWILPAKWIWDASQRWRRCP
jgi:hypothetical protein